MHTPTSTVFDASLIATPSATSPPTGTFALSFGRPEETESSCLTVPGQRPAWDCDLALNADIGIKVNYQPGTNQSGAHMFTTSPDTDSLYYGTQASSMMTSFSPFLLVKDKDDPQNGEAFYFQAYYNKVVVVPGNRLPGEKEKRDDYDIPNAWFNQKEVATAADKPWICYWNDTIIEGFIYPKKPAVMPSSYVSSSSSASQTSASKTSNPSSARSTSGTSWPAYLSPITGSPSETVTSTLTLASTICTYTGAASGIPDWVRVHYPDQIDDDDHDGNEEKGPPAARKRGDDDDDYTYEEETLHPYPYLMKFEERRGPDSPSPYCVKYQVLDNGDYNWVANPSGGQIVINLKEKSDENGGVQGSPRQPQKRDDDVDPEPGTCHCQWMVGETL